MAISKLNKKLFVNWLSRWIIIDKLNDTIDIVNDLNDGAITTDTVTAQTVTATTAVVTDTITERTATAGVTIDGILLKDDLDTSNIVDKTTSQTISGAKTFSNVAGVITDVITERTAAAGVTIDGLLLKDGGVGNGTNMFAGFITVEADIQALSGPGVVGIDCYVTKWTTTGPGDAGTLANGSQIGQLKKVRMVVDGGDGVLTPTLAFGYTSITFDDVNDEITLMWFPLGWRIIDNTGCTVTP